MLTDIQIIKKALLTTIAVDSGESISNTPKTTVTEDAPLLPYQEYKTKPKDLPLEQYSLKPAGDLRRMKPIAEQLATTTDKIKKLDEDFTHLRTETDAKINALKAEKGYEESKTQLKGLSERAAAEIQRELLEVSESYGESKKILLEYEQRVYAIYDEVKATTVSDKERLEILTQAMNKLLAPELVKSVTDLVDQAVKQTETAKKEIKRKLVSWEPAKTIRKQVKEELPKKVESKKIQADIGSWLSDLWKTIKGLFSPLKDTAAELQSLLEVSVMPLLADPGATKKAAIMPWNADDYLIDGVSYQELIDTVIHNEPVRDEAAVKKVFKELLQTSSENAIGGFDAALPEIMKIIKKQITSSMGSTMSAKKIADFTIANSTAFVTDFFKSFQKTKGKISYAAAKLKSDNILAYEISDKPITSFMDGTMATKKITANTAREKADEILANVNQLESNIRELVSLLPKEKGLLVYTFIGSINALRDELVDEFKNINS